MTWPLLRYQWLDAPPAHRAAEAIDLLGFVGVAAVSSSLALLSALPLRLYAPPQLLTVFRVRIMLSMVLARWRCYCTCA